MNDFKLVPESEWPSTISNLKCVWLNKYFLVQQYQEANNVIRLSINSVQQNGSSWADGITWDQLNSIKNKLGFKDSFAVECFPEINNVVNVANMRHLWVLPERPSFAWVK